MKILVTNDDGYSAKGLLALVEILRPMGELLIVAPKTHQSGMSMAVTMGYKPIAVRKLSTSPGEEWWYLDGTPASCIKYGIDNILWPQKPDLVVCGINHGSNAPTAAIYSGTVGAAMEGAVNGVPSVAVSLDSFSPDADFSAVGEFLPGILEKLALSARRRFGAFYNINFPALPASLIKGVRAANMGMAHWEREYVDYRKFTAARGLAPDEEYLAAALPDEEIVVMAGDFTSNPGNLPSADHLLLEQGYVTITPQCIDNTDFNELNRLCDII